MIRRFDQRPIPAEVVDRMLDTARRAPSAGFSQGLEFLVLDTPETVSEFWRITADPTFPWDPDDVAVGPTLLVFPLPDKARYLERYSQPDKADFGMQDESNWPVAFWDVDAAMASMLMLLSAVDEGLGGWYFGFTHGEGELLRRFGVPEGPASDRRHGLRLCGGRRGTHRIVGETPTAPVRGSGPPQRLVGPRARGGIRTLTPRGAGAFKAPSSASSDTRACRDATPSPRHVTTRRS